MRELWDKILDFIFPPSEETLALRAICKEDLFSKIRPAENPPYQFINSVFSYKDPLGKELVWNIKYKKDKHAIELGAFALYKKILEEEKDSIIIPVPISKKRRKERGYNQCEILIDRICELDKEKNLEKRFDILFRKKHTKRQTLKKRVERIEESKEIFEAISYEKAGLDQAKRIIILDDVTTTGSTAKSAWETLSKAGYRNIAVFTLAR